MGESDQRSQGTRVVLEDIPATFCGRVLWQNINQKFIPGSSRKRTDDRSRFDHKHDEDESLDDDFGEDDDYGAITTNRSYQRRCFLSDGSFAFRDGQCRVKRSHPEPEPARRQPADSSGPSRPSVTPLHLRRQRSTQQSLIIGWRGAGSAAHLWRHQVWT